MKVSFSEQSPIIKACFRKRVCDIDLLLMTGDDVNTLTFNKRTALHIASHYGYLDIVRRLCENGAEITCKDNQNITPLHIACKLDQYEVVEELLKHRADVNARDKHWQTPLHIAAGNNAVQCTPFLLKQIKNVNICDRAGHTPLHHACLNGYEEMVKLLLKSKCEVNCSDKKKRKPIHWASYMGHNTIVDLLLQNSAQIDCKDNEGYTPLHAATSGGQYLTVSTLAEYEDLNITSRKCLDINSRNNNGSTPLHLACLNGEDLIVTQLLNYGADINAVNSKGLTPLHISVSSQHASNCMDILLDMKAKVSIQAKDGKTPLHLLAIGGNITSMNVFLNSVKDTICLDTTDNEDMTALHYAASYGHSSIIETLMSLGSKVNLRNNIDQSCLHLACLGGHYEACQTLIISMVDDCIPSSAPAIAAITGGGGAEGGGGGAGGGGEEETKQQLLKRRSSTDNTFDIDHTDTKHRSCLHSACHGGNNLIVHLLLDLSSSLRIRNFEKRTPLHYACIYNHPEIASTLIEAGSELNAKDIYGCQPLHYAAAYNTSASIVDMLIASGADLMCRDAKNYSILHYIAVFGNVKALSSVTAADETIAFPIDEDMTIVHPIHIASFKGYVDIVENLSYYLDNLDFKNEYGQTALHLAAYNNNLDCCLNLLNHKAFVMEPDNITQATPLHVAAAMGHVNFMEILVQSSNSMQIESQVDARDCNYRTPLMMAAMSGNIESVELLLKLNADINAIDSSRRTIAHILVYRMYTCGDDYSTVYEMFQTLVKCHLDLGIKDINGRTPAHLAAKFGLVDLLRFFPFEKRANLLLDNFGYHPLHLACYNGCEDCVSYILEINSNVLFCGVATPLHIAIVKDQKNCIDIIMEAHPKIEEIKDIKGRTPLHMAAEFNAIECAQCIVGVTSDVDSQTLRDQTPLHLAVAKGHEQIIDLLLEYNASADIQDDEENTPLHIACINHHDQISVMLLERYTDLNQRRRYANLVNIDKKSALHIACSSGLYLSVHSLINNGADMYATDNIGYTPFQSCALDDNTALCLTLLLDRLPSVPDKVKNFALSRRSSIIESRSSYGLRNSMTNVENADLNVTETSNSSDSEAGGVTVPTEMEL